MSRIKKPESTPVHMNAALWKALAAIVSTDDTRPNLTHIHARDARTWEATDGHCAVQVTFDADTELAPGLYNPKLTLARVKASVAPESTNPNTRDTWEFPNVDQVMPEKREGFHERADASFNPALLSRVCDAVDGILRAVSGVMHTGVTVDLSDDLSPALVYGKVPGAFVRAAIMPMRVGDARKRPKDDRTDSESLKKDLEYVKNERDRFASEAGRLSSTLTVAIQAREAEQKRADAASVELDRMADYRAHLESVVSDLRAEVIRLTNELNEAREAADTDAADAARARETADELRAELNTLRHLRPKAADPEPVLLTRPMARA